MCSLPASPSNHSPAAQRPPARSPPPVAAPHHATPTRPDPNVGPTPQPQPDPDADVSCSSLPVAAPTRLKSDTGPMPQPRLAPDAGTNYSSPPWHCSPTDISALTSVPRLDPGATAPVGRLGRVPPARLLHAAARPMATIVDVCAAPVGHPTRAAQVQLPPPPPSPMNLKFLQICMLQCQI
jgi:hypothetical protein